MKRKFAIKTLLLVSIICLTKQAFTLVDSTTDNQLPNMREWQNPKAEELEVIRVDAETESKVYQDKQSDIEEMESGGDPELGWVS